MKRVTHVVLPDGKRIQLADWHHAPLYTSTVTFSDHPIVDDLEILAEAVQQAMQRESKQEKMTRVRREKHREMIRNARRGR